MQLWRVQLSSLATESTRLTLVQILLQRKGLKMNPFTTMYYVSPVCFVCLLVRHLIHCHPAGGCPIHRIPK
jgi:hypothetical protein